MFGVQQIDLIENVRLGEIWAATLAVRNWPRAVLELAEGNGSFRGVAAIDRSATGAFGSNSAITRGAQSPIPAYHVVSRDELRRAPNGELPDPA